MSPTRVGIVPDPVRGENIQEVSAILQHTPRDAAVVVNKVLKSAIANAENSREMDIGRLYVTEVFIGADPTLKRFRSMDHGKAFRINKRTSDIALVVKERA